MHNKYYPQKRILFLLWLVFISGWSVVLNNGGVTLVISIIFVIILSLCMLGITYVAWIAIAEILQKRDSDRENQKMADLFISNPANYWVRWHYTKSDKQRQAKYELLTGLIISISWVLAIGLIIPFVGVLKQSSRPKVANDPIAAYLDSLPFFLTMGAIMGGIAMLIYLVRGAMRLHKVADTYIGMEAIYHDGKYFNWTNQSYKLEKVILENRMMNFYFKYQVPEEKIGESFQLAMRWSAQKPTGEVTRVVYVPRGKEEEAKEIFERFKQLL